MKADLLFPDHKEKIMADYLRGMGRGGRGEALGEKSEDNRLW